VKTIVVLDTNIFISAVFWEGKPYNVVKKAINQEIIVFISNYIIDEIRKAVNIPVLSIIEETVRFLQEKDVKNVGLLATPSTVKNKLFDSKLNARGIKAEFPRKEKQELLGEIINKILQNNHGLEDKKELLKIISEFSCDSVLLACTDLHILLPGKSNTKILDTMQILRQAAVRELLG